MRLLPSQVVYEMLVYMTAEGDVVMPNSMGRPGH